MRSRSCALHSDSEEQFLQLAQATLDNAGIFYDEKINRKAMANIGNISAAPQSYPVPSRSQLKKLRFGGKNLYQGFDFGSELQGVKEEIQQLERIEDFPQTTFNIGIISSHPDQAFARLSTLLSIPLWNWENGRGVDLVVLRKDRIVFKVWVFDRNEVANGNHLLQLYVDRCNEMIDIEEVELSRRGMLQNREDLLSVARLLQ